MRDSPGIPSSQAVDHFRRDGYCVLPRLCDDATLHELLDLANQLARNPEPPFEYEADTGYPGAPASVDAPGGRTLRRLLGAWARHELFQTQARTPAILDVIAELLGTPLYLSQAHHNCVMFKDRQYGSETGWHQDMRYWRFDRPDLITAWFALTDAGPEAGCLYFVPGSHRLNFSPGQFDSEQFFRADLTANAELLQTATAVPLAAGDVVLFHSRLLHAAYNNQASQTRTSLIFTYHQGENRPIPGTRSAARPDVCVRV